MKLSIGYITSRLNCELGWFLDSLRPQLRADDEVEVIVVDGHMEGKTPLRMFCGMTLGFTDPKPNAFSGRHRLTKENWWSKSSSINTFLCYANHDYVVMVDDRCVVGPRWMEGVRAAAEGNMVVAGSYEKREAMTVKDGVIKNGGIVTGVDARHPIHSSLGCPPEWFFGCCTGAPLEWWLEINGAPERCDGLSFEDVICGFLFANNGHGTNYDPRMLVIQDRTPDLIGPSIRRSSKERHPWDTSDKAHTLLREVRGGQKQSLNGFDMRELRLRIRAGEKFPLPDPEMKDWFDQQPIKEFV